MHIPLPYPAHPARFIVDSEGTCIDRKKEFFEFIADRTILVDNMQLQQRAHPHYDPCPPILTMRVHIPIGKACR